MARVTAGRVDPERARARERDSALHASQQRLTRKPIASLSAPEQSNLLELIAIKLGLADENGVLV